jgi:NAD(P) transhydrogenase
MEELSADYVVIGSGPAGQKGAIQAAKLGKKVIVLEQGPYPGGASLNSGTLPSKSLREAILDLTDFYKRSFYAKEFQRKDVSIHDLNYRLSKVLEERRQIVMRQFRRNKIQLLHGQAQFEDPHHLQLLGGDGKVLYRVKGERFLIATGSKPRNPLGVPFDERVILDSTRLLAIDHVPKTLLVLGGGVIGSEYASFFAALGTKVTVVDKRDHLLSWLDVEISAHLQSALGEIGLNMIGKKELDKLVKEENHAEAHFTDGTKLSAEMVLYALGREANIGELFLEAAHVTLDQAGYIAVNGNFQTNQPHIYAAGDVIGGPSLASTSMEQGRLAACHACGAKTHPFPTFYPIGIYTIPEISFCGYTEEQLKEQGVRYEVGRCYYYEIARNLIVGNDPGMFKILFDIETLEILGVHIIGRAATEVIHIGQVAMSFKARIDYFIDQVFNYPTYAEGYRTAALNGYNKLKR